MYTLESPHRGDSNEYTQHTIIVYKIKKISLNYHHLLSDLEPWLTLSGSNYPYLERVSMIRKMFQPLRLDCFSQKRHQEKASMLPQQRLEIRSINKKCTDRRKRLVLQGLFYISHQQYIGLIINYGQYVSYGHSIINSWTVCFVRKLLCTAKTLCAFADMAHKEQN